jgi:hypothetical protein
MKNSIFTCRHNLAILSRISCFLVDKYGFLMAMRTKKIKIHHVKAYFN